MIERYRNDSTIERVFQSDHGLSFALTRFLEDRFADSVANLPRPANRSISDVLGWFIGIVAEVLQAMEIVTVSRADAPNEVDRSTETAASNSRRETHPDPARSASRSSFMTQELLREPRKINRKHARSDVRKSGLKSPDVIDTSDDDTPHYNSPADSSVDSKNPKAVAHLYSRSGVSHSKVAAQGSTRGFARTLSECSSTPPTNTHTTRRYGQVDDKIFRDDSGCDSEYEHRSEDDVDGESDDEDHPQRKKQRQKATVVRISPSKSDVYTAHQVGKTPS